MGRVEEARKWWQRQGSRSSCDDNIIKNNWVRRWPIDAGVLVSITRHSTRVIVSHRLRNRNSGNSAQDINRREQSKKIYSRGKTTLIHIYNNMPCLIDSFYLQNLLLETLFIFSWLFHLYFLIINTL